MVPIPFPSLTAAEACASSLQRVSLVPSCINNKHVCIALARQRVLCVMQKSSLASSSIFTVLRILHAERFGHLRLCIEPDWHAVSSSKKTAMAQLIKLGEWLGCRDSPRVLQWPELICLQRGADAILAAVNRAGGAQALAAADPAAAILLCHGLMQLPGGVRKSVQHEFAALAPDVLPAALADVSALAPGSP